jgi:hypothetical protein
MIILPQISCFQRKTLSPFLESNFLGENFTTFSHNLQTCHELMLNLFWMADTDAKDENWKNTKTTRIKVSQSVEFLTAYC